MLASAVTFWRWLSGQPLPADVLGPGGDPEEERRVWLRYAANLNVRCEQVNGETEGGVYAVLCNISRGGVQLIAPRRFEPGTVLSVELPASRGQSALAVLACVVRADPHGDSEWAMGCRFSAELNDEHLQTFGAARTRPPSSDPRNWSRFPCNAKAVYTCVGPEATEPRHARVLNIAAAGMALLVQEEVVAGELLSTELQDAGGRPLLSTLACVVHAQRVAEGRLLGCNFIRELSDRDVRALL